MINNLNDILSNIAKNSKRSAIREILKLTQQPDIISFAGGLPAPESFPVEELNVIVQDILKNDGAAALQYDATEGLTELRKVLAENYQQQGIQCTHENIVVTTASQQGLDLIGKVFINPGDTVICGLPSYLGGLTVFASYGAEMVGIPLDKYGMRADVLEQELENLSKIGKKPKFIYVIPDFQNPAGITMPESRRKEIIKLAHKYDVLLIEDSPYREIRFEGKHQPTMYQLDNTGHVVTLGSFSKIVAPGFRLGWILAHPDILDKLVVAKQSVDLCTPTFLQKIAAKYLASPDFKVNLAKTIKMYQKRRDVMIQAFKDFMPKEVSWTEPEGGLFLFLNLPTYLDAEDLLLKAINKKVAYVVGHVFHCNGKGRNTMRLNFSFMNEEKNREGVKRLATVIKNEIKKYKLTTTTKIENKKKSELV